MERDELLTALRRLSVETGSLACLGCGHEHGCGVKGCAVIRAALAYIEELEKAADRLAEYEDTERTPEEIKAILEEYPPHFRPVLDNHGKRLCISVDRITELAKADKEGRLVVPPCKVGDTVYEIDLPEYGVIVCRVVEVMIYNGPMFHVDGNEIVSDVSIGCEVIEGHGKGSRYAFSEEDFGKTVFLTREAAEAALKEKV